MILRRMGLPLLVAGLVGCDSMGPETGSRIAIAFSTAVPRADAMLSANTAGADLVLTGSNGQLRITSIHMIVNEFELERARGACARAADREDDHDDDCEKIESGPFFIELPLGGTASVVSQEVPPGAYSELEFEVEDLDLDDEDDDDMDRGMADLLRAIRDAGFTSWPEEGSMVVRGTFTPTGGTARSFTTWLKAEIEIEMEFEPPLQVDDVTRTVTIEIDPSLWFRTFANTVIDLSAFDFATTGKVLEFEARFRSGLQRLRFDD